MQNISGVKSEGEDVCATCNLADGSDVVGCLLLLVNASTGITYSSTSGGGGHSNDKGRTCFSVAFAGLYILKAYDINLNKNGSLSREPAYVWPQPVSVMLSPFYLPTSPALPVSTGIISTVAVMDGELDPSISNPVNCADTTG